jgi:phenylpropionate dioxygenase-like ring-hydroxylating dioxygenase large terminal subunit
MDRCTELELIDELLALKASRSPFLDESVTHNATAHYVDETRYALERTKVLRPMPAAVAHASELAGSGAFMRCEVRGLPALLTRDKHGQVHAFLNVCRHRGARLVEETSGCRQRFTCPYHAWTYANSGELFGAPHFDAGFPSMDRASITLSRLPAKEAFGLIWVVAEPDHSFDFDAWFAPLARELDALGMATMHIVAEQALDLAANWKILVEGGIEAYHFRVAHRGTIGPYFEDNLSTYRAFGPHLRSVLPRTSMALLDADLRDTWRLRDHANVLYTLFPTTQLLVQQDHVVWITQEPVSAGRTAGRLVTLAPIDGAMAAGKDAAHWQRNHQITATTLEEDFAIGEGIQAGLASGANSRLTFGRFEGALGRFNSTVQRCIELGDMRGSPDMSRLSDG